VGLIEASERYNEDQSAKYSTYAYYWIEKFILKTLGKQIKVKQAEGQYEQKIAEDPVTREATARGFLEQLPERKQKIIELYSEGHTQEEIADRLDMTQGRISQTVAEIRENQVNKNHAKSV